MTDAFSLVDDLVQEYLLFRGLGRAHDAMKVDEGDRFCSR
jgi:hypothetical protein